MLLYVYNSAAIAIRPIAPTIEIRVIVRKILHQNSLFFSFLFPFSSRFFRPFPRPKSTFALQWHFSEYFCFYIASGRYGFHWQGRIQGFSHGEGEFFFFNYFFYLIIYWIKVTQNGKKKMVEYVWLFTE